MYIGPYQDRSCDVVMCINNLLLIHMQAQVVQVGKGRQSLEAVTISPNLNGSEASASRVSSPQINLVTMPT